MKIRNLALATLLGTSSIMFAEEVLSKPTVIELAQIYNKAVEYYKKNDFKNAYDQFLLYEKSKFLNVKENFMLARSAFELGMFTESLIAYERILFDEPDNLRVQLEIGLCYFRLKRYDEARKIFNELLLNKKIPDDVKKNIALTLEALEKLDSKHIFRTTLGFGYLYDSNIDNGNDYLLSISTSAQKRADKAIELIGALNHTYKLNELNTIESKAVYYSQNYINSNDKDIVATSFESVKSSFEDKYKTSYGIGFDKVFLATKPYLNVYNLVGRYDRVINEKINYQGQVKVSRKDFLQSSNKDLNAYVKEIKNALSVKTDKLGTNRLELTISNEKNRQGRRTDVNKDNYTLIGTNTYEFPNNYILNSSISYSKTNYKNVDATYQTKREDSKKEYSIGITKAVNKTTALQVSYKIIDNQSNQSPYDYEKSIIKFNLFYSF